MNCPEGFRNTDVFETCFSDFQKLTFTILKQYFPKKTPKLMFHGKYKNFRNELYWAELENALSQHDFDNMEYDTF